MEKLEQDLPSTFTNEIEKKTLLDNGFHAIIRSNCSTDLEAQRWICNYGRKSATLWHVDRAYPYGPETRVLFRKDWKCSNKNMATGKACPAKIVIKIRKITKKTKQDKDIKKGLQANIEIIANHNHVIEKNGSEITPTQDIVEKPELKMPAATIQLSSAIAFSPPTPSVCDNETLMNIEKNSKKTAKMPSTDSIHGAINNFSKRMPNKKISNKDYLDHAQGSCRGSDTQEEISAVKQRKSETRKKQDHFAQSAPGRRAGNFTNQVFRLKEPFIKLEDRGRKYRPYFEALERYPKINFDPNRKGCIFAISQDSESPKNKPSRKLHFESAHTPAAVLEWQMTEYSPQEVRAKHCELCGVYVDNMIQHLAGEAHKKMIISGIYDSLDAEIAKGPSFDDFIRQEIAKYEASQTV